MGLLQPGHIDTPQVLEEKVEQLTSSLNTLRRDHLGVSAKHFRLQ